MFLASFSQQQKESFFCLAHNVVVSDGDYARGEQLLMDEMRREMNLPKDFEPSYMAIEGMEKIFNTRKSRAIALMSLIRLGYADGAFEIEEQCLLQDLARLFSFDKPTFALLENWVRRQLALEDEALDFF